jgi:hypothetical protein
LRKEVLDAYIKWLISQDDNPKALSLLQHFLNESYVGRSVEKGFFFPDSGLNNLLLKYN